MAVTRADKEQELQDLSTAFKSADTAILVDYKGLNVPAVTELRRQIRGAKATYKVVKNTLAKRASKDTKLALLEKYFEGTTARFTGTFSPPARNVMPAAMARAAPTGVMLGPIPNSVPSFVRNPTSQFKLGIATP